MSRRCAGLKIIFCSVFLPKFILRFWVSSHAGKTVLKPWYFCGVKLCFSHSIFAIWCTAEWSQSCACNLPVEKTHFSGPSLLLCHLEPRDCTVCANPCVNALEEAYNFVNCVSRLDETERSCKYYWSERKWLFKRRSRGGDIIQFDSGTAICFSAMYLEWL